MFLSLKCIRLIFRVTIPEFFFDSHRYHHKKHGLCPSHCTVMIVLASFPGLRLDVLCTDLFLSPLTCPSMMFSLTCKQILADGGAGVRENDLGLHRVGLKWLRRGDLAKWVPQHICSVNEGMPWQRNLMWV